MKTHARLLCYFLVLLMVATMAAGCSSKNGDQAVGGDSGDNPPVGSDGSQGSDGGAPDAADPNQEPREPSESAIFFSSAFDENGFWKDVRALDYVELFDYRALKIPEDVYYIDEADVQAGIESIFSAFLMEMWITDRAVTATDTVNVDFTGTINGVEFEGGSTGGMGLELDMEDPYFLDGFLVQLVGRMPGETITFELTIPNDYYEESLRGKRARFVTVVNHIVENYRNITDNFVEATLSGIYGWKTVDEMKAALRSSLRNPAVQRYVNQYLSFEVPVKSIPVQMTTYLDQAVLFGYQEAADKEGVELNDYLKKNAGVSNAEELQQMNKSHTEMLATLYLVIQAVAEDAGITVDHEDLEEYFRKNAGVEALPSYEERYGLPWLKQNVICQTVVDFIVANGVYD